MTTVWDGGAGLKSVNCPKCGGKGTDKDGDRCTECGGTGSVKVKESR